MPATTRPETAPMAEADKSPGILTLQECFQKALKQSETLGIQEQTLQIAEAHYLQALGTALPHLNVNGSEMLQDQGNFNDTNSGTGLANTFNRFSTPSLAVTLTQPLFNGFRALRAISLSTTEKEKSRFETERAKQLLFFDVARAYYTILELEKQLGISDQVHEALSKRVGELSGRIRLGKSRDSERLMTESQLAAVNAGIEHDKGVVTVARDMLGFLIGQQMVPEKLVDDFPLPAQLPSLEHYLALLPSRPDLYASQKSIELYQGQVSYEKGKLLPSVNLQSDYYPYRVGFYSDIKWDVIFTMTVPLFEGGATKGVIRQAQAALKQSELEDQRVKRQAQTDLQQAYHTYSASRAQGTALQAAEEKATANYKAQQSEYGLGLVTNLDVLTSLQELRTRSLETNQTFYQSKLDYLQLKVTAGQVPIRAEDFGEALQ